MSTTETHRAMKPVAPYLAVRGALRAIDFYREAFGATVVVGPFVGADGRVGHVELEIEGAMFMMADEHPEIDVLGPESVGGTPVQLSIEVADVDSFVRRAEAAGATVNRPVEDRPYGARSGGLIDPFGHRWIVATPIEALADDEVAERLAAEGYDVPELPELDLGERGPSTADPASPVPAAAAAPETSELHYFTVGVPDGERARAFYGELLGWETAPGRVPDGWQITNVTPAGGIHGGQAGASLSVWFRVADIDLAVERVRLLGGQADEPTRYGYGRSARCVDDQGLEFNLSQPDPEHG